MNWSDFKLQMHICVFYLLVCVFISCKNSHHQFSLELNPEFTQSQIFHLSQVIRFTGNGIGSLDCGSPEYRQGRRKGKQHIKLQAVIFPYSSWNNWAGSAETQLCQQALLCDKVAVWLLDWTWPWKYSNCTLVVSHGSWYPCQSLTHSACQR